jgi:uncharacterized integral membrane protein (TIGR00698 family)
MEGCPSSEPVKQPEKKKAWPGVLVVLVIAAVGYGISSRVTATGASYGGFTDPVLLSMVAGIFVGNLIRDGRFLAGAGWASRTILPAGIVLLGARMDFFEALKIGLPGLALSVVVVGMSIALMLVIGGRLGVEPRLSCLLGVGTGICGGTAIVAIAPLLKTKERDVMIGVGLVTLAGLVAMLILPALALTLGFSPVQFGMLAGLTIQQTPQAIAAGFAFGEEAGHIATVAKLTRVCLLAPVAAVIAWVIARESGGKGKAGVGGTWFRFLPKFALGFLLLAAVRSLGLIPEIGFTWKNLFGGDQSAVILDTTNILKWTASFFLCVGMAGVGYQTRFSHLGGFGWRPIAAMVATILLVTVAVAVSAPLLFQ